MNSKTTSASAENKMGVMPIVPLVFNMAIPMIMAMLVQALYNIVDSIFVSRVGEDALTALSLAFPVQNLMMSFGVGTSVGVNAMLSRRLGEKKQESVNRYAMNGVFLSLCTYLVFCLLGFFFMDSYLKTQTSSPSIIGYGKDYLSIIVFLSFGCFSSVMFDRLLQATGRTFLAMVGQGVGAVFNIIFDPLLIFGLGPFPRMLIKGAALATVLGQILGLIVAIFLNLHFNKDIQFKLSKILPKAQVIISIYKIALPSIALSSITSFVTYFINLILGSFSTTAIAVYGVYFKLQSFIFMPVFGLNNGVVPILAYNYGAKHKARILKTMKVSVLIALSIMLLGLLIFQLFTKPLFSFFNASPNMLLIGIPCLRILSLSFPGAAIGITISNFCQSFGNAVYSMLVSFSRQLVILLPACYLLSLTGNVNNVWFAFIIAEVCSVLLSLFFLKRVYDKKIKGIPS